LILGAVACVEGGNLAISAGAPATAAVTGVITDCGTPVSGAEVVLRVQQDEPEQARPVDVELGPVSTDRDGSYVVEVAPPFAVPGAARVQLRVAGAGVNLQLAGLSLNFSLSIPPRDTARIDADLGTHRGSCRGR
jgi:hypothetical protein